MPALLPLAPAQEALATVATAPGHTGTSANPEIKVITPPGHAPEAYQITISVDRIMRERATNTSGGGTSRYRNYYMVLLSAKVADVSSETLWATSERIRVALAEKRINLVQDEYIQEEEADVPKHGIAAAFDEL